MATDESGCLASGYAAAAEEDSRAAVKEKSDAFEPDAPVGGAAPDAAADRPAEPTTRPGGAEPELGAVVDTRAPVGGRAILRDSSSGGGRAAPALPDCCGEEEGDTRDPARR